MANKSSKPKKRKPTKNQIAYEKEIKRIKRGYRELQKQGYRFTESIDELIPKKPDSIRQRDLAKLKKITRAELRKKATAISEKTGKVVSGTQAFKERKSEAAKKGAETRKTTRKQAEIQAAKELEREFFDRGVPKDFQYVEDKVEDFPDYGEIVLANVQDMIAKFPGAGSEYLGNLLTSEINRYGEAVVAGSLGIAPEDMIQKAQDIIFYMGNLTSEEAYRELVNFADLIKGTIMDNGELMELGNVMEEMTMGEDYDIEDREIDWTVLDNTVNIHTKAELARKASNRRKRAKTK